METNIKLKYIIYDYENSIVCSVDSLNYPLIAKKVEEHFIKFNSQSLKEILSISIDNICSQIEVTIWYTENTVTWDCHIKYELVPIIYIDGIPIRASIDSNLLKISKSFEKSFFEES